MKKQNNENIVSFLDFLKKESGLFFSKNSKKDSLITGLNKSHKATKIKFEMFGVNKSKDLEKVLAVKISDDYKWQKGSSLDNDWFDNEVSRWSKYFFDVKNKLLKMSRSRKAKTTETLVNIFTHHHFNIPGLLSFCREKETETVSRHWSYSYLSLVLSTFVVTLLLVGIAPKAAYYINGISSQILINSWRGNSADSQSQHFLQNKDIDDNILAEYIKKNSYKIRSSNQTGKNTFIIAGDDLFGRVAGATEDMPSTLVNSTAYNEPEASYLYRLNDVRQKLTNNLHQYFSSLSEKQEYFSYYLSNTLEDYLSR